MRMRMRMMSFQEFLLALLLPIVLSLSLYNINTGQICTLPYPMDSSFPNALSEYQLERLMKQAELSDVINTFDSVKQYFQTKHPNAKVVELNRNTNLKRLFQDSISGSESAIMHPTLV